MGKGVVASFFPQVAERGYQLVYGATANLFTDRAGNYIGFGPEESELAAIADLDTFAVLPWDSRVARVYCDCYDTETGELLDADPRQNLKRIVEDFESELGLNFLIGIEPEMMWLRRTEDGGAEGVTKPYCYHIHMFEELRPVLLDVVEYGRALGLDMSYGDHEDAPGQLELNFRFDRPVTHRRQHHHLPADHAPRSARKHGLLGTFMPKPFTGVSANGHHHHFTLVDDDGNNVFHDPDGAGAALRDRRRHFLGGMLDHFGALMCVGNPTVNSYCRMWDTGFWAPIYKNWGWQNRTCTVRVASGGRFEYRGVDSSCNPYLTVATLLRGRARRDQARGRPRAAPGGEHLRPAPPRGWRSRRSPTSLGAALEALAADEVVRGAMPGRLYNVFEHYKRDEWERYLAAVTDWERDEYLEVLP